MSQPRLLSLLSILFAFAGPAFGQTVSFLDAQGNPATVYLEGSRVFLRVEDPAANTDGSTTEIVVVDVSAALTGDAEQVQLTETGPATGVFAGSIQLSLAGPSVDGLLQTSRFTTTSPPAFDTLTATYGAASASAGTEGPTVAVLDASGNEVTSFMVGDKVHFRLRDGFANGGPSVDTIWLEVMATVRSWNEYELVNLTETGGDTSVFEGSVQTVQGIDPVQMDGVVELEPTDLLQARHYYPAWGPYVIAEATALSDLPVTITFLAWNFATDEPISEIYEFSYFQIRVTDGAAAGQNTITVRVTSDLRGDEELMTLSEDGNNLGTFYAPYGIAATMSPTPPATDGLLEVTEIPGPPHQFDTVRATPVTCSVSPCPTAVAGVIGSSVRFLDSQGEDTLTYSAGDTVTLEVRDYTVSQQPIAQTTATLVSQAGDSETVSILAYFPYTGLYRGSILCEEGPPVPGDGVLQVEEPDTITASHLDPLGFSSSTDTATVGSVTVVFLDRFGNPADFQFESAWARVQARHPGANLSPGTADTLAATLQTVDVDGNLRDSEPVQLTETGPDTDVFTGQIKLFTHYNPQPNDGRLDSWYKLFPQPSIPDNITATVDTVSATVPLLRSKIWFIDSNGADATQYPAGSPVYVRLESEGVNFDPAVADTRFVQLVNLSNNDFEYPLLTETGPDTSIFEGSYATNLAPPEWDDVLNVQPGHTIRAVDAGGYAPNITDEASILAPLQPDAVNDTASLAEDGPAISIPVLANDTAPEGRTLAVSSVTQGTRGATAIQGDGTITYTPNANANGSDSFTYTVTDSLGLTDTATVSITISAVNDAPDAVSDSGSTNEDAAVTVSVLANDSDPENNSLAITAVTQGANGAVSNNGNGTVTYTPGLNFNGSDSFSYSIADGNGGADTATVTVTVRDSFSRVAVLGTNSVWLRTGSDVLSGDVIVNQAGAGPFLNGSVELSLGGTVTTPAGWDVQADSVTIAGGTTVASDLFYNQLTNNGTVTGSQSSPLALPVFASLPTFLTATPGSTDVNVANNGSQTLAAGSYRDLIVGRKATVTFTGGVYHFRTIQVDREAKLYFSAASEVRVQQKLSTKTLTTVGPATGASITAANIVFHVAGVNGTSGGLAATPKAVDVGTNNVFSANVYAPNGTVWLEDGTQARGAFLGRDVQVGIDVQVTLQSAW